VTVRAPGTVRVIARYLVLGRPASMTFYFFVMAGHPPTAEDVAAIGGNYVLWERGLFGFFDGYSTARSDVSALIKVQAQSIDPNSEAFLFTDLAVVDGEVPSGVEACLPTTLAPMIIWSLAPGSQRMEGRTYAVGVAADQEGTSDKMQLNAANRAELFDVFGNLHQFMFDNGAQMVALRTRRDKVALPVAEAYPITGCFNVNILLGSQRRRTFRGR